MVKFKDVFLTVSQMGLMGLVGLIAFSCTRSNELKPIQLMLIPSQETQVLEEGGRILAKLISEEIDYPVEAKVPVNYSAVIEAFGSKRVDVSFMNSFGFLIANEKYQAQALLIARSKGKTEYFGQIIVRKDRIKKINDLNNKNFAFVSPSSGSGYISALKFFKENKISIGQESFMGRHDSVVAAVYQGRVDAGATFYASDDNGAPNDARRLVKQQYPDVFEKVERIALTGPLPNEVVVFRKDLSEKLKEDISKSLKKIITTKAGSELIHKMYHFDGFEDAKGEMFESLKSELKLLNKDPTKLVN